MVVLESISFITFLSKISYNGYFFLFVSRVFVCVNPDCVHPLYTEHSVYGALYGHLSIIGRRSFEMFRM